MVYSGFNPFSSAGFDLDGWSFVIDLRKGAERLGHRQDPTTFDAAEIYDAVTESLVKLDVTGFSVDDRVFVHGSDIRDDRALLPDVVGRPATSVPPDVLAGLIQKPTHRIRHYRSFRVLDWRGELVVTLDAVVDFLDGHGLDTTELAERRETIINHGIMVPGGAVQAHNLAVGQNAGIARTLPMIP